MPLPTHDEMVTAFISRRIPQWQWVVSAMPCYLLKTVSEYLHHLQISIICLHIFLPSLPPRDSLAFHGGSVDISQYAIVTFSQLFDSHDNWLPDVPLTKTGGGVNPAQQILVGSKVWVWHLTSHHCQGGKGSFFPLNNLDILYQTLLLF